MKKWNTQLQKDKSKRCRAFIKALQRISSTYGVAIETIAPPEVLPNPQPIRYQFNDDMDAIEPQWEGKEGYDTFYFKNKKQ